MEQFFTSLDGLETCAAVLTALMRFARAFGMDCVAVGELPADGIARLSSFFYSTWPQAWFDTYVEHGLAARDPLVAVALHTVLPFTWSDLHGDLERWWLRSERLKMLDLVHEFGWTDGFAVPVHGPGDYHGVVSYAGKPPRLSMSDQAALQIVSLYAHDHMLKLHRASEAAAPPPPLALTEREMATLRLMAAGRTDSEIAAEIGVTERTVLYYVRSLRDKLGCLTRAQLIAQAIRTGIIA